MKTDKDNNLALVAIVPRKKDWNIIKSEHWYRIPVNKAPTTGKARKIQLVPYLKYIAFYQPKIFGEEKWTINYYAKVISVDIVKRIDLLPDEPNHLNCNEDYYKITISALKRLRNPIPCNRWRRIVFIPTTLHHLFQAKEINDLYYTSPIEEKLYTTLKKENIAPERQVCIYETERPYCLDFALFCRDGNLNIECDGDQYHYNKETHIKDQTRDNELTSLGWSILRFPGKKIIKVPKDCLQQIKRTIRALGGVDETKRLF